MKAICVLLGDNANAVCSGLLKKSLSGICGACGRCDASGAEGGGAMLMQYNVKG